MGHHCPVCHKATHKRCMEKGHLKVCRQHGTVCGNHRQCVNCYEELRETLTPRKTEFAGKDVEPSLKRESKPAPNPRSKKSAYTKLKEALRLNKTAPRFENRLDETTKTAETNGASLEQVEKEQKPAEQTVIEDPTWYQRHVPNSGMLLRQAKPNKRSKNSTRANKKQEVF